MCSFVNFKIFRSGEDFSTSREGARKWLLSSMDSYVVDQLVLGFEGFSVTGTILPEAGVVRLFGTSDMLYSQMGDDLVHCREKLSAGFTGLRCILIDPQASVLLFDRRTHVAEESSGSVRVHSHVLHAVSPVRVVVILQVGRVMEVIGTTRRGHLVVETSCIGPTVHITWDRQSWDLCIHVGTSFVARVIKSW